MASYEDNLEKYKKMQKKTLEPEYDPMPVVRDRFIGKPLMFVMVIMAILLLVTVIGGGYKTLEENVSAVLVAACCLALTYAGHRMSQASKFYKETRRWLKKPGSVSIRQLAINTRKTQEDTLKLTKEMVRRKYYRNLTISEDKKTIIIAEIAAPQTNAQK